jgi:GNAT superfamily N-acetyltransferase
MQLRFLADAPEVTVALAKAYHAAWPGSSVEKNVEWLRASAQKEHIPLVIVALSNNEVCGAVALLTESVHSRPQLGPWLGGLIVWPEHRLKGLGAKLVAAAEVQAQNLGVPCLYTGTALPTESLTRQGWETLERLEEDGEQLTVLRKQIAAQPGGGADGPAFGGPARHALRACRRGSP